MKIAILAQYDPNMFPALYRLAGELVDRGNDIRFTSRFEPKLDGLRSDRITWVGLPVIGTIAKRFPVLRSVFPRMLLDLVRFRPDWIIAEHQFLVPALLYKRMFFASRVKVAGYFCDYYTEGKGMAFIARLADRLDAYVDVCDVRLQWRQRDWPNLAAERFVLRHASYRKEGVSHEPHSGRPRVVFTGSRYVLDMNRERLSRFIARLCDQGVAVDWYIPGSSELQSSEALRSEARSLTDHPLFRVREPVEKARLFDTLGKYDAGLFWAPMAELGAPVSNPKSTLADPNINRSLFFSAASNKVSEYIAAGLVVAHTGNPGLSYLPEEICTAFDPTDPEAGADQLAAKLSDRSTVERKRQAALRYHRDELNFEVQAAPLVRYVTNGGT